MLSIIILSSILGSILCSNQLHAVRGVSVQDQVFYNPIQDFTCLDGSKTIPFKSVNDDFCDCADSSDEPGTAACPEGRFHCSNLGFKSLLLQSSRVNDGICDCCDGSDEYDSSVVCFNQCQQLGMEDLKKREKEIEESHAGFNEKQQYIEEGKMNKAEKQKRLDYIKTILEERRTVLEELKTVKEAAETPEKEAKDQHESEWNDKKAKLKEEKEIMEREEAYVLLDTDKNGWLVVGEIMSNNYLLADQTEAEAKDLMGGEAMVNNDKFVDLWQFFKPKFIKDGRSKQSTEEAQGENENGEKVDEQQEESGSAPEVVEQPPPEAAVVEEQMPEYNDVTQQLMQVADEARKNFDEEDKKVRDLDNEQKQLEEYLNNDFGGDEEFASLTGKCFEYTDREYTYKLCPFDKVTQRNKDGGSETDLGKWGKWIEKDGNKYSSMKYENGQGCWNGPSRSALIRLSCGKENSLLSVVEPSRCEYEMEFKTPALCVKHPLHGGEL